MSQWALAVWLSLTLLLFCLPGCCLLRGPRSVKGTEGETLSLQFQYEEKYKTYSKYWCRRSKVLRLCENALKTKDSETEVSTGRASISDHPENLTFTVTLKDLLMEDAGSYWCGIHIPWTEGLDDSLLVEVSVFSSSSSKNFRSTLELPTQGPPTSQPPPEYTWSSTTRDATLGPSPQSGSPRHLLLLSLLMLLLLLLVGALMLAWRMLQRRVKAGKPPELSQNLSQTEEQTELQYANLQLQTWSLQERPAPARQAEVEYSTVAFPTKGEDLHYSSVVFNSQKQDSNTRRPQEEAEYSLIQKPGKNPSSPPPPS
ncbi:CMRF35-like molecule 8 isoform 2-T2 [Thomomys bottae]